MFNACEALTEVRVELEITLRLMIDPVIVLFEIVLLSMAVWFVCDQKKVLLIAVL